jgi:hypothetical protein
MDDLFRLNAGVRRDPRVDVEALDDLIVASCHYERRRLSHPDLT